MYLDRRDTVSFARRRRGRGQQGRPTWSTRGRRARATATSRIDGERMAAAAERYRTDKVKPLAGTGTSSVQYEPVLVAPVSK